MAKLKVMKGQIEQMLSEYPETRNSDLRLTQAVWWRFYNQYIEIIEGKYYISLPNLFNVPSQDDIKRIRAKIQNDEHKYLPTNWEVAKLRHWKEEEYRKFLGYNPELRTV